MHERFKFSSILDIRKKAEELHVEIPLSENTGVLGEAVTAGDMSLRNRIVFQPMEGCDAELGGSPSKLTYQRYESFAKSGAGMIWFEAVAVTPDGRAQKNQLIINEKNSDELKRMVSFIRETAYKENHFSPLIIMQATHSGRYSKPEGKPAPIIAYNNPVFEKENKIDKSRIISDDGLQQLEEDYFRAFQLCKDAGFDGVDIKCCHRYLNSELLSAYTRDGSYGGSFENRTRFIRNLAERASALSDKNFILTSRLNVYDGFPYPYGFGVSPGGGIEPDITEGKALVGILRGDYGMKLINVTIGNPYVNPHVNRPYDNGGYVPLEHPLEGLSRMIYCCGEIQKAFPDVAVITSGNSYLRQFAPNMAAGVVEKGLGTLTGFGRMAFAYPDFPHKIFENRDIEASKSCIACGKCAELLRGGHPSGCVARNDIYRGIYAERVTGGVM